MQFVKSDEGQHNVLKFLQRNKGKAYSAVEIAENFDNQGKIVSRLLQKLYNSGFVNKESRKIYKKQTTNYYWVE